MLQGRVKNHLESTYIESGCKTLGVEIQSSQVQQLAAYLRLLDKWSHTYNLTAIKDPLKMVQLHLLDSLAVAPYIQGQTLVDVGTGAGLPGIPLAILLPQLSCALVDSNLKKIRFLTQVKIELGLENVEVKHSKVENLPVDCLYDTVISRAFASIHDMLERCGQLVSAQGKIVAMKGKYPADELEVLPGGYALARTERLVIPGAEERHLVFLNKTT